MAITNALDQFAVVQKSLMYRRMMMDFLPVVISLILAGLFVIVIEIFQNKRLAAQKLEKSILSGAESSTEQVSDSLEAEPPIEKFPDKLGSNDMNNERTCPYCCEIIRAGARVCRYCNVDLETGKPFGQSTSQKVTQRDVRAKSGIFDGVKLGCGMFIVLPILIILAVIVFVVFMAG